jgi:hypothetical protein
LPAGTVAMTLSVPESMIVTLSESSLVTKTSGAPVLLPTLPDIAAPDFGLAAARAVSER